MSLGAIENISRLFDRLKQKLFDIEHNELYDIKQRLANLENPGVSPHSNKHVHLEGYTNFTPMYPMCIYHGLGDDELIVQVYEEDNSSLGYNVLTPEKIEVSTTAINVYLPQNRPYNSLMVVMMK